MTYLLELKPEWGFLATFVPNKRSPVYNWLYYKEGYSAKLVSELLAMFEVGAGQTVLDPFAGVGTTLLACKQNGVNAIGTDVQPIAAFASSVKTRDYDTNELRDAVRSLLANKFEKPIKIVVPSIVQRCFSKYAIEDIMFFRRLINNVPEEDIRNFLLLGLVHAAMKVSWAWKDGGVIKVKKHPAPPLRKMFAKTLGRMIRDLERFGEDTESEDISQRSGESIRGITSASSVLPEKDWASKPTSRDDDTNKDEAASQLAASRESSPAVSRTANVKVIMADARKLPLDNESIDAVITSPPYLNQIDYQRVYAIENWIISGETAPLLHSFIGGIVDQTDFLAERNLPPQARAYLQDMNDVLSELWRVCKGGARIVIVVGNAYFPPPLEPVESDALIAELAERLGFTVEHIFVLNQRAALKNRTEKVGLLRESAVILKKE